MGNHGWGFPAPCAVLPALLLTTASGVCSQAAAVRPFGEPTSAQSGSLESSLAVVRLNSSLYPWQFGGRESFLGSGGVLSPSQTISSSHVSELGLGLGLLGGRETEKRGPDRL